jgi:small-conductance mechanosensitive channel
MDNLDQVFNPESNWFWNLLLAAGVVVISFLVARLVRRRVRAFLDRYELEDYAGALLARIAGWSIVLVGVILALSIMGVDMVPVVRSIEPLR